MERFRLLVSLFLAQNHGRKLSDIFGVRFDDDYEWILDIGREGVTVRVHQGNSMDMGTAERYGWCCVYVDDSKMVKNGDNLLEFWWAERINGTVKKCVNYFPGNKNGTVDIENYISLEDKI